jgi:hypothetical protein
MDFTNVKCISQQCKGNNVKMDGAGGSFGGRISYCNLQCPVCDTKIMIMPISDKYEYSMSATTEEERTEKRIKEAKEKSELALAKEITRIKDNRY